jgi:hypothetical protein
VRCANGLHEIDPADTWRAPNRARCRECYLTTQLRYNLSDKGRARYWRYYEPQIDAKIAFYVDQRRRLDAGG